MRTLKLAVGSTAALALNVAGLAPALSAEPSKGVMRYTDRLEQLEMTPGSTPAGRMIYSASLRGTQRNASGQTAERRIRANWDLTQGNGLGYGTTVVTKDGNSITSQWTGACTTLQGKDNKPFIYCAGGWVIVPGSGTGQFAGMTGGGSWWGTPNAEGGLDGESEGFTQQF